MSYDQRIAELEQKLRESEAAGAVMREIVESSNCLCRVNDERFKCARCKVLSTDCGKSLLAELNALKKRVEEAEWLLINKGDYPWPEHPTTVWVERRDKWFAEGKVK